MAKLTPVFLDLETFWSPTHSLTKMNPIIYCTHPETEIISCSAKVDKGLTCVTFGEAAVKKQITQFDWSDKIVIAHNMSGFDSMILAWRCGIRPAMWGCTLAMARPHHAKTTGLSLAKLVEHYGIGVKNNAALLNTKGRHLKDFTLDEIGAMGTYNKEDTEQCAALFHKLLPLTSKREMQLIDMTIRMLVTPKFRVDVPLLEQTLIDEQARKHDSLLSLGTMLGVNEPGVTDEEIAEYVRTTLGSAPKFSALLSSLGVAVPTKISPATGLEAPALAKTDEGFLALQEHENPVVAAAALARLGVKSTILESRVGTFLDVARATKGRMPVPINYYGADTTGRDSGCLVAETMVLVYDVAYMKALEKRITEVLPTDLVWDGEAFVAHDGVVFSGYAEVIEWDTVKGTPDHEVYTETGSCSLSEALQNRLPITACRTPTQNEVDAVRVHVCHH